MVPLTINSLTGVTEELSCSHEFAGILQCLSLSLSPSVTSPTTHTYTTSFHSSTCPVPWSPFDRVMLLFRPASENPLTCVCILHPDLASPRTRSLLHTLLKLPLTLSAAQAVRPTTTKGKQKQSLLAQQLVEQDSKQVTIVESLNVVKLLLHSGLSTITFLR